MHEEPRIIFLHIPKTAGQSVHEYLLGNFPKDAVCPARVNDQMKTLSTAELARYQVFSGHFDWSAFDALEGPRFVFTILRDPMERLLSFYFYLREQATHFLTLGQQIDDKPGVKAALEMTPWEYFVDPDSPLRGFIDNHYDNFYCYYFAGRSYDARTKLLSMIGAGRLFPDMAGIMRLAQSNLTTLDAVHLIENWKEINPILSHAIGRELTVENTPRVNIGKSHPGSRIDQLRDLGASDEVMQRLAEFTYWDNRLMAEYQRP